MFPVPEWHCDDDDRTDPESGGVHFDPANPFSLLGQDGEVGGDGEGESETKVADLEQQPSSVASAEMARDGAMALSDEEVLEEAMARAQQEWSKLGAKSSEDSGRGGGGQGADHS